MASVQLENGYTRIANEILEEISKVKLSPTQYRLLFIIWRYTYGFKRKQHKLSLSFLSEATECDSRQIQRELKRLEERKLIFQRIRPGSIREISFNKNHNEWIGKTSIGEITNGKTDNKTNGEIIKGTNGETDNQEINKRKFKETDNQSNKLTPYLEYKRLFGNPSATLEKNFIYWIEESNFCEAEEIICETIRRAKIQEPNKPGMYIQSILKKLHNMKIYTLSEVKEYNAKFDAKLKNKENGDIPPLSNMFNEPTSRFRSLSDKQIKEIHRIEKEFPF